MYKGDALTVTGKPSTGDNAIGNLRNCDRTGRYGKGKEEEVALDNIADFGCTGLKGSITADRGRILEDYSD